jgi:hypothetical protein
LPWLRIPSCDHDHSKHIDVKFHYTRECVEHDNIELKHIGTNEELVDTLTNALGAKRFHELREKIGVLQVSTIKKQKYEEIVDQETEVWRDC